MRWPGIRLQGELSLPRLGSVDWQFVSPQRALELIHWYATLRRSMSGRLNFGHHVAGGAVRTIEACLETRRCDPIAKLDYADITSFVVSKPMSLYLAPRFLLVRRWSTSCLAPFPAGDVSFTVTTAGSRLSLLQRPTGPSPGLTDRTSGSFPRWILGTRVRFLSAGLE